MKDKQQRQRKLCLVSTFGVKISISSIEECAEEKKKGNRIRNRKNDDEQRRGAAKCSDGFALTM